MILLKKTRVSLKNQGELVLAFVLDMLSNQDNIYKGYHCWCRRARIDGLVQDD